MVDYSQILTRSSSENGTIGSMFNSQSFGIYTSKPNGKKIYKIEFPFQHCHRPSTVVDIDRNILTVKTKLVNTEKSHSKKESPFFRHHRKLPDNLDIEKMSYYFSDESLLVEIPILNEEDQQCKLCENLHTSMIDKIVGRSLKTSIPKYSIGDGQYIITENLGDRFQLENIQLKVIDGLILQLTAFDASAKEVIQKNVNVKKEYKFRSDICDLNNATANISENHTLNIYIPIKSSKNIPA